MRVKERSFFYAQMHLKLHSTKNKLKKNSSELAVKYFSDRLEHFSILVRDFSPSLATSDSHQS